MDRSDLSDGLRELYAVLRDRTREQWNRDLPLYELLFDRWERARENGFGDGASIYHSSYVYGDVEVGPNTWIGPHTLLDGSGGLRIGSNCSISTGVQIYTHDTVKWAVSGGVAEYEYAPVSIGDSCYLGPQTVVAKGVTVGDQSVVGACSFVNRSLPHRSIAVGIPCHVVGHVGQREDGDVELVIDVQSP
jgi:acetyltransferase-like isoleucine patch superfamily enzyme